MGFWAWLQVRKKEKKVNAKRKTRQAADPKISQAFNRVKGDIKNLENGLTEVQQQITQHTHLLNEHTSLFQQQNARLATLEERVTAPAAVFPEGIPATNRPVPATNRLVATNPTNPPEIPSAPTSEILDLHQLTEQEKRILGVFLDHRSMALSYLDIAKSLHKSPHTIKNQLRQLTMKAPLFDIQVDGEHKNRFQLKKHLKLQADLPTD